MAEISTKQFISFTVGDEEYGVDIIAIREIKGWTPTTPLPEAPLHMRGVIDLRGAIVPIIDLRVRFHNGRTEVTPTHVIIVVAIGDMTVGLLADAVVDILTVPVTDIQPPPDLENGGGPGYVGGIVTVEGRMVVLLDLVRLMERDRDILSVAAA
ncbi:chemotaxis protein CheW [Magnetospirillum sp. SS-4]|uniref:chemotaxis protein CheW n=1 Tax=Magnetospirillum sp. SS-4 TaxID=2681465 RepID=UPI001384D756|nr:chemotaxis protein CheW [Magnetospirillum sp. SS-4]CAA7624717.1 Chemotaxis protein CheW [Magnetospirillum sp. SS-4]